MNEDKTIINLKDRQITTQNWLFDTPMNKIGVDFTKRLRTKDEIKVNTDFTLGKQDELKILKLGETDISIILQWDMLSIAYNSVAEGPIKEGMKVLVKSFIKQCPLARWLEEGQTIKELVKPTKKFSLKNVSQVKNIIAIKLWYNNILEDKFP